MKDAQLMTTKNVVRHVPIEWNVEIDGKAVKRIYLSPYGKYGFFGFNEHALVEAFWMDTLEEAVAEVVKRHQEAQ